MWVHVTSHFRHFADLYDAEYEFVYSDSTTVQAVIQDFAKRFSLDAELCAAYHHGPTCDTILSGKELLLQVAGHQQRLTLSMDFRTSTAFYIWQSFRKGPWQPEQKHADLEDVWLTAAEVCSTEGCIAASIANNSSAFLSALLAVDPLQELTIERRQHSKTNKSSNPYKLPQVEPLGRSLMLFAQLLTVVAAEPISSTASVTSTAGAHQLRSAIASKLQQLTDNSCCTPVLLKDPIAQDQASAPKPLAEVSKRVHLLRSAILLVKLATLTFNVKVDFLGSGDYDMPMAVHKLWLVMTKLSGRIHETSKEPDGATPCSRAAEQEEEILAVALLEHLVLTLRQIVKEPKLRLIADLPHAVACLGMSAAVLSIMPPEVVRREVKRLGALPLVVAFLDLDQGWKEGRYALRILYNLCAPAMDPGGQHANLLARLHAVRRLSDVLCTVQPFKEHMKAAGTKANSLSASHQQQVLAKAASACSPKELVQNVNAVLAAVYLMITLLELHPLSQRPPPKVSGGLPAGKDTLAAEDIKAGLCGTPSDASTQARCSFQSQKWATPKPNDWQDIKLIAIRAFTTLGWARSTTVRAHTSVDTIKPLVEQMCQLIQHLLAGHLPDLDLDMQTLFDIGLQPVLDAELGGHAGFKTLAAAMLSRLATDSSLMVQGRTCARHICHIFCLQCHLELGGVGYGHAATPPPSALLRATIRVLHSVVTGSGTGRGPPEGLAAALELAISVFADEIRLSDQMMLCASLGALSVQGEVLNHKTCCKIITALTVKGSHDAIFTTLDDVMQVSTPWDEELCLATAAMLNQCGHAVLLQSPSFGVRCEDVQSLLVQLLQQLRSFKTTVDHMLHRLLLNGCFKCLHCLSLQPGATNHSAVVPAMSDWISILVTKPSKLEPVGPRLDPIFQIVRLPTLVSAELVETLICSLIPYLDSQQKWHDYAQHGLSSFLYALHGSMWLPDEGYAPLYGIGVMSQASKHQALQTGKSISMWTRVGCAAITLLSFYCSQACHLRQTYKQRQQEQVALKLLQKKDSHAENDIALERLEREVSELLAKLRGVQKQLAEVVPALHGIQQEPAWPSIMAGHWPEHWQNSEPPPDRHRDLVSLLTEDGLNDETWQAIEGFYTFMLRDGQDAMKEQWEADEARAAAAAEELMAEEVYEAAKAAAKKAKKQKAKARKQQARSSATSAAASPPAAASEVSAGACLQDVEAMAALHYSSSSGSTSHAVPPDQDTAGLQTQLQQLAVHDSAMHALPVRAVLEEEVATSASAGGGFHAGTAQAYGVAQGGNASFLDQLFCCPITQVVMVDPVIAADGHTYERTAIQHWLQGSSLSPVTGDKLPHTRLVPNVLVKSALAQHAQES